MSDDWRDDLDELRSQFLMTDATIDKMTDEIRFLTDDLDASIDVLYDSLVLFASCDSCRGESLERLKALVLESKARAVIAAGLINRDRKNGGLLEGAGVDLASWSPPENESDEG
jgi:hypothetical protein